jgi:hypothetical protein
MIISCCLTLRNKTLLDIELVILNRNESQKNHEIWKELNALAKIGCSWKLCMNEYNRQTYKIIQSTQFFVF